MHNENKIIVGIDEAGRGALAGSVVVCAVAILDHEAIKHIKLDDSKVLTKRQRNIAYEQLMQANNDGFIKYSRVPIDNYLVDKLNVLAATSFGASICVGYIQTLFEEAELPNLHFIIDGGYDMLRYSNASREAIPKADSKYKEVMAASIIAKVTRDAFMDDMNIMYPGYDFAKSKGYCSPKHLEGIASQGICDLHRRTFTKVKEHVQH